MDPRYYGIRKPIRKDKIAPYLFISPFFIAFAIFGLFPLFFSIFLSFQKWSGMGGTRTMGFMGLRNFAFMLFQDNFFWKAIGVTAWLLLFGSLSQHVFALPLAIILNSRRIHGSTMFRTAFFLPFITSSVSVTIIFTNVFTKNYGLLNYVLKQLFAIQPIDWISWSWALPIAVALIVNWRFIGWNTIVYIAGLQSIPKELYESAEIDGASFIQKHLSITLPLMTPIIFFAVSMSIIGGMALFDEPFVLTGGYLGMGGPNYAVFTTAYYIMWSLQKAGQYGRGSAVAWLLFLIVLIMTFMTRLITNRFQSDYIPRKKRKMIEAARRTDRMDLLVQKKKEKSAGR